MPSSCSALNCKTRQSRWDKGISFHRFPYRDKDLLNKWLVAIKRKDWMPSRTSVICSKHFDEKDYAYSDLQLQSTSTLLPSRKFLRKDAIPSIFRPPKQRMVKKRSRKSVKEREKFLQDSAALFLLHTSKQSVAKRLARKPLTEQRTIDTVNTQNTKIKTEPVHSDHSYSTPVMVPDWTYLDD